jgi:predicted DsbA family dithiol-disulfide isomerase
MVEFADSLSWTYVMGGLAREYSNTQGLVVEWLNAADEGAMPLDPRLWTEGPIASTYPACMAVKAATEQSSDGGYAYLRALREGLFCFRRKLDTTEALVEEARRVKLDVERFRIDLGSHAIVEAFGADLEQTREAGVPLPTIVFEGGDGTSHTVAGFRPYDEYREAAVGAGAQQVQEPPSDPSAPIQRFGRCATRELEELTGKPGPVLQAELWALARDWRLRPVSVLGGTFWELV